MSQILLIVDDNESFCDGIKILLEEKIPNILIATSVKAAYDLIDKNKDGIKVIILDIVMPGADGFMLLKWIRVNLPLDVAVIVMSAIPASQAETMALALGADIFLDKSTDPKEMKEVVMRYVSS